ncbi:MAG: SIMPL domain-containing protein, partial [Orrella sp.]
MALFREKTFPAIVIAVGLVVAGWSVGEGLKSFRQADRFLTIKGLAEQDVKSDFAIWTLSFRRAANNYDEVRRQLTDDREAVVSFLLSQGFSLADIERRPLQITDLLARDFGQQDVAFRYTGQAAVTVRSMDVDAVAKAATSIDPLIQQGVQMSQE